MAQDQLLTLCPPGSDIPHGPLLVAAVAAQESPGLFSLAVPSLPMSVSFCSIEMEGRSASQSCKQMASFPWLLTWNFYLVKNFECRQCTLPSLLTFHRELIHQIFVLVCELRFPWSCHFSCLAEILGLKSNPYCSFILIKNLPKSR